MAMLDLPDLVRAVSADRPSILVVDDDRDVREAIAMQLEALGYEVMTAASAEAALDVVERRAPQLVLTDVHMGEMSGIDLCVRLKADPRHQLTPVIILTGVSDLDARIQGLAAGADDFFAKPVELTELRTRLRALLRVKGLVDQLERAEAIITTLGATIEARDPYTAGHCERLARYSVALGDALGVPTSLRRALRLGGYLHDLGKIAVADSILLKPGHLDADERRLMALHPHVGDELVRDLRSLDDVRPIIRHHHERMDGTGYPDGLHGDGIPLGARIMAVVDVYDALRTARPYKVSFSREEALRILLDETDGGAWDPIIVTTFDRLIREHGEGPR